MKSKEIKWALAIGMVLFFFQNCGQQVSFEELTQDNVGLSSDFPSPQTMPDNSGNENTPEPGDDSSTPPKDTNLPVGIPTQIPVLGGFSVIGISGGSDMQVDSFLASNSQTIEVHHTGSANAESYEATISSDMAVVCAAMATNTQLSVEIKDCELKENNIYYVEVIASDSEKKESIKSPVYEVAVDLQGPVIKLLNQDIDIKSMSTMINIGVVDNYQVNSVSCEVSNYSDPIECQLSNGELLVTLTNLQMGDYNIKVNAEDSAGNISEFVHSWRMEPEICDPLNGNTDNCDKGLKGEIFYLTSEQGRDSSNHSVDTYFSLGTRVNATLYMSQVNVPERSYDEGFVLSDGNLVVDNRGEKLVEYFALRLNSFVQLSEDNEEGFYAFSLLSDDGSILSINSGELMVNNDGNHGTRFKCSSNYVYIKKGDHLPMNLKYYQGPKNHIALVMLWKKVNPDEYNKQTCTYNKSWKPLASGNFIAN